MKKFLLSILFIFPTIIVFANNLDIQILKDINLNRNKNLDQVFGEICNYAGTIAYGLPLLLLGIGLSQRKRFPLHLKKSIYMLISILSSGLVTTILKHLINRPRPFITYTFIEKMSSGGSPSFPSGHTADAFALATSLSLAFPKWYIAIPSYTWALFITYLRMDLGVHYPSDILGGIIVGAGMAVLYYFLFLKKRTEETKRAMNRKIGITQRHDHNY